MLMNLRIGILWIMISLCLTMVGCFVMPVWAAAGVSDLNPPIVTVITPQDGLAVDTATPLVKVSFYDTQSGIDEKSISLSVDKIDVTGEAIVDNPATGSQTDLNPFGLYYRPIAPFSRGTHQVYFGVRDQAGNLAEIRWSFRVIASGSGSGGTNTFTYEYAPISKITDTIDLGLQAPVRGLDIRLGLSGRLTDYPGGTAIYSADGYYAFLDKYFIDVRRGPYDLSMGDTSTTIASELYTGGRSLRGAVLSTELDCSAGEHSLAVFSGKTVSSYGIGIAVDDIMGVGEQWKTKSGFLFNGFYANLNGPKGYDLYGISGQGGLAGQGLLRLEMLHGVDLNTDNSGNGYAGHFDLPVAGTNVGFDLTALEPSYRVPGLPSLFSDLRGSLGIKGGGVSYGVRTNSRLSSQSQLFFNGILTHDNLDGSAAYTVKRDDLHLIYTLSPSANVTWSLDYQNEILQSSDHCQTYSNVANVIDTSVVKQFTDSSAKANLSFESDNNYILGVTTRTTILNSSWLKPFPYFNLTALLEWTNIEETGAENSLMYTLEARLTADKQFQPDLPRSTVAVFVGKNKDLNVQYGIAIDLNIKILKNITFMTSLTNTWWFKDTGNGKNVSFAVGCKTFF